MTYDIKLLPHQRQFVEAETTFIGLVGGLGSGKSDAGVFRALVKYLQYGKTHGNVGYWLPTFSLLQTIVYPRFLRIFTDMKVKIYKKQTPHIEFRLAGYKFSLILKSYENPELLIGFELVHLVIDELDTLPYKKAQTVFTLGVARTRIKVEGVHNTVAVVTTPDQGVNGFMYNFFVEKANDSSTLIKAKTRDNPFLPEQYIESLTKLYTPVQVEAMLNGEFVSFATNKVYPYFRKEQLVKKHNDLDLRRIHIGIDFNIGGTVATYGVLVGKILHIISQEVYYDTREFIDKTVIKYPNSIFIVYPDASGHQRSTNSSYTDINLIEQGGFKVVAKRSNPLIVDRVNTMNGAFFNNYVTFEPDLDKLFSALMVQSYTEKGEPEKSNNHPSIDDRTDSLGYMVHYMFDNTNTIQKIRSNYVN